MSRLDGINSSKTLDIIDLFISTIPLRDIISTVTDTNDIFTTYLSKATVLFDRIKAENANGTISPVKTVKRKSHKFAFTLTRITIADVRPTVRSNTKLERMVSARSGRQTRTIQMRQIVDKKIRSFPQSQI